MYAHKRTYICMHVLRYPHTSMHRPIHLHTHTPAGPNACLLPYISGHATGVKKHMLTLTSPWPADCRREPHTALVISAACEQQNALLNPKP